MLLEAKGIGRLTTTKKPDRDWPGTVWNVQNVGGMKQRINGSFVNIAHNFGKGKHCSEQMQYCHF
jgi:hypothetical protein